MWRNFGHSFSVIPGSAPGAATNMLYEAKGIVIEANLPVPLTVAAAVLAGL